MHQEQNVTEMFTLYSNACVSVIVFTVFFQKTMAVVIGTLTTSKHILFYRY